MLLCATLFCGMLCNAVQRILRESSLQVGGVIGLWQACLLVVAVCDGLCEACEGYTHGDLGGARGIKFPVAPEIGMYMAEKILAPQPAHKRRMQLSHTSCLLPGNCTEVLELFRQNPGLWRK